MDYQEVLRYLDQHWTKTDRRSPVQHYPFQQLAALLNRLGSPQAGGRFVHVAGSKGKGSTARIAAQVLRSHGLRVGLLVSPHLERVEERIQVTGRLIAPGRFARLFSRVLRVQRLAGLDQLGVTPLLVAMALLHFRARRVDWSVVEVGVGGRFDATNIIPAQVFCITPVGLEHVPALGHTLPEIAWQKAGIVKPGGVCVAAPQTEEVQAVLAAECERHGVPLLSVGREVGYRVRSRDRHGQRVDLWTLTTEIRDMRLSLLGEHQAVNAAVAVAAAEQALLRSGRALEAAAVRRALRSVRWPGRMEVLARRPLVVYDGAHTREAAVALATALVAHFGPGRWTVVMGSLARRHPLDLLLPLAEVAEHVVGVPVPGFRCSPPDQLAEAARSVGLSASVAADVSEALGLAIAASDRVCITGTLYLYQEARGAVTRLLNASRIGLSAGPTGLASSGSRTTLT